MDNKNVQFTCIYVVFTEEEESCINANMPLLILICFGALMDMTQSNSLDLQYMGASSIFSDILFH